MRLLSCKYLLLFIFLFSSIVLLNAQYDIIKDLKIPTQIKFFRAYGANNENLAPILILHDKKGSYETNVGEDFITLEFDIDAQVAPNLYLKIAHCNADWSEDNNVFLNEVAFSRTNIIDWIYSPVNSTYYTYRGRIAIPNPQIKINFSGNWKAKLYDYDNDSTELCEFRFFVVSTQVLTKVFVYSDLYFSNYNVTSSAYTIETYIQSNETLSEHQANTCIIYRNNRYYEPLIITNNPIIDLHDWQNPYKSHTSINGYISGSRVYRIEKVPANNGYRVLDLSNTTLYPRTNYPLQLPISDIRRNGYFYDYDSDGIMVTDWISSINDDYVIIDFALDTDGWYNPKDEVFITGSFNNWNPDSKWQMYWDEKQRLYKLRQWIRRGRHDYLYATGKFNTDLNRVENVYTDVFEGNTSSTGHSFISFIYYKKYEYGTYDAIIGVAKGNIYSNGK